jgi:hypothetical protein
LISISSSGSVSSATTGGQGESDDEEEDDEEENEDDEDEDDEEERSEQEEEGQVRRGWLLISFVSSGRNKHLRMEKCWTAETCQKGARCFFIS